jgi:hypothetical protein
MKKYTINDLTLLSNLAKVLGVSNNTPVTLEKTTDDYKFDYIALKDEKTGEIVLDCHFKNDKNLMYGIYKPIAVDKYISYNIKGLCPSVCLLTEKCDDVNIVRFLKAKKYGSSNIAEFLKKDITVIDSTSIANMEFLTIDDQKEGKTLIKQMEKNKNS